MVTLVSKCSECMHKDVCKNKDAYLKACKHIEDNVIQVVENPANFWVLKDCPILDVNIVCPSYLVDTRIR